MISKRPMVSMIVFSILSLSFPVRAAISPACRFAMQSMLMDYYNGFSDQRPRLSVDVEGKIKINDLAAGVKRAPTANGETFTYITRFSPPESIEPGNSKTVSLRTQEITNVVTITKSSTGSINAISRSATYDKLGTTTSRWDFTNDNEACTPNQFSTADNAGNTNVTFDKAFCDKLSPLLNQMGHQNAAQCSSLIASAQRAYNERSTELSKENKTLRLEGPFGSPFTTIRGKLDEGTLLQTSLVISSCTPNGMGFGMGAGMGFNGMGGGLGTNPYMAPSDGPAAEPIKRKNSRKTLM